MVDNFNTPQGRLLAAQKLQAEAKGKVMTPQVKKRVLTIPDADMEDEQNQDYAEFLEGQRKVRELREVEVQSTHWEELPEEQIRKSVTATRKQAQEARKTYINPVVKEKLELLVGLKRKVDSITIDNTTFTLKSLSRKEYRLALKNTYLSFQAKEQLDISPAEFGLEFQCQQLALALMLIDEQEPFVFFGTDDPLKIASSLEDLSEDLVSELFEFFKTFKITNPPKTEELVEDLKK